jgi:uncharacterized membrane protein
VDTVLCIMSQRWLQLQKILKSPPLFLSILVIVLILALMPLNFFINRYFYPINPNNALYLLSALAQSQAAIIAIVVSLTLVAIQLSAQTYSPRVIDVFIKTDFRILMIIYGISIFVDFLGIYVVPSSDCKFNIVVYDAILLAFIAFAALLLFIWKTFEALKPSEIIKKLASQSKVEDIARFSRLNSREKSEPNADRRTLEPIVDIVYKSIMNHDIATTRQGIYNFLDKIQETLQETSENRVNVVSYLSESLGRMTRLCLIVKDEELLIELTNALRIIGLEEIE